MDNDVVSETLLDQQSRIAALEANYQTLNKDLEEIIDRLDDLLHLKSKGMGALWLVSLILGSGVIGAVAFIVNLFNQRPHL